MKYGLLVIGLLMFGSFSRASDPADFKYPTLAVGSSFKSLADFYIPANIDTFKVTPSDPTKWAYCVAGVTVHSKSRVLKAGKELFANNGRVIDPYSYAFDFYSANGTSPVFTLMCPSQLTIREINDNYMGDFEIIPAASEEIP